MLFVFLITIMFSTTMACDNTQAINHGDPGDCTFCSDVPQGFCNDEPHCSWDEADATCKFTCTHPGATNYLSYSECIMCSDLDNSECDGICEWDGTCKNIIRCENEPQAINNGEAYEECEYCNVFNNLVDYTFKEICEEQTTEGNCHHVVDEETNVLCSWDGTSCTENYAQRVCNSQYKCMWTDQQCEFKTYCHDARAINYPSETETCVFCEDLLSDNCTGVCHWDATFGCQKIQECSVKQTESSCNSETRCKFDEETQTCQEKCSMLEVHQCMHSYCIVDLDEEICRDKIVGCKDQTSENYDETAEIHDQTFCVWCSNLPFDTCQSRSDCFFSRAQDDITPGKCQIKNANTTCDHTNGFTDNEADCICGSTECNEYSGRFCYANANQCSKDGTFRSFTDDQKLVHESEDLVEIIDENECQQAANVLWNYSFVQLTTNQEPPHDDYIHPNTYIPGGCSYNPLHKSQAVFNIANWTMRKVEDGPFGLQYAFAMFLKPCTGGFSTNTEMCSCSNKVCMEGDYCVSVSGEEKCLDRETFDIAFNAGSNITLSELNCTYISSTYINNQCCC